MIRPLRNTHRRVWIFIAVLLPVGIIASWLVIPDTAPVKVVQANRESLFSTILAVKETPQYCARIRSNENKTSWQLEWTNKLPLTVPTAVIYLSANNQVNLSNDKPVGRIESRGEYLFPLITDPGQKGELHLVLYDFIHSAIIDSLNFNIRP